MQPHITYFTCTWLQLNGPKLDLDTQRWRKGPLLRIHSPWLSNKHHIQGLLSLLLFLKYFSSLQISFLWPGGCSGHSRWRWRFTALGEILLIFMIRIVFPRTKSFSPKGITGFVLAPRGKFIIGIIEQHLPETDFIPDFMSSKTYSRKSTASCRCCATSSHLLLSTCHTWSDLQGALWHGPAAAAAAAAAELGSCGHLNWNITLVFTSAHCCASVAWQSEDITMVLFNPRVCFHFIEGLPSSVGIWT